MFIIYTLERQRFPNNLKLIYFVHDRGWCRAIIVENTYVPPGQIYYRVFRCYRDGSPEVADFCRTVDNEYTLRMEMFRLDELSVR